jgi:hypothetical protein
MMVDKAVNLGVQQYSRTTGTFVVFPFHHERLIGNIITATLYFRARRNKKFEWMVSLKVLVLFSS